MRRRGPEPFQFDFDDLSGELDDEDEAPTLEMGRNADPDFDALFPDDDPPTQVKRPNWPKMPAGRRMLPSAALPALPPPPKPVSMAALEMTSPAVRGAYYSAPRPPPASHQPQPGNSPSIAPVMLAAVEASSPARSWTVFLGAALVGCAAVAVATVPLLLKGFAFHEATTNYVVAAPVAPPPARKIVRPRAPEDHVPGAVVRIEDLPVAAASIDELPLMPDDGATPAPKARAPSKAAPSKPAPSKAQVPATPAKPAERAAAKPARDSGAKSMLKAALDASNPAAAAPVAPDQPVAGETDATLHVVANPPANVAVDGRPLGMTPQTMKLSAGPHVIVFAGAESREVRQIDLSAGGEKTVSVSF